MLDDNFDIIDTPAFPQLDTTYAYNLTQSIQDQMEERTRQIQREADEAYEERQMMQDALNQTAKNTAETNEHLANTNAQLKKVVTNQNEYIEILRDQLTVQKSQLDVLKSIFSSNEDEVEIEQEIIELIRDEIDESHTLWDYVKDKGGDLAVAGITAGIPVLYNAFKALLASKGIMLS